MPNIDGTIHDLLRKEGFAVLGKVGTPVDSMGRATAVAVAICMKHGVELEAITKTMRRLDDYS